MLIDIWQRSIRNYLGVNDVSSGTTSAAPLIRRALAASGYIIERGHWIDSAPGGGVYCRRCGVFVKEVKHRRLKISYRDVLFSSVGESELLDKHGYDLNPHRLMHLLATMKDHCRERHLAWDGSISCHHPVGQLHCLFCGKKWPWNNRHNMKQQPCSSSSRQRSNTLMVGFLFVCWIQIAGSLSTNLDFLVGSPLSVDDYVRKPVSPLHHPLLLHLLRRFLDPLCRVHLVILFLISVCFTLMTWADALLTGVAWHLPVFP